MSDHADNENAKCRCGARVRYGLRARGTNAPCCGPCYDESWWGHNQEWEAMNRRSTYAD